MKLWESAIWQGNSTYTTSAGTINFLPVQFCCANLNRRGRGRRPGPRRLPAGLDGDLAAQLAVQLGAGLTIMAGFVIRRFLIRVRAVDPWTLLTAASGIVAVALAASLVPAWRASRVDPLVALRDE